MKAHFSKTEFYYATAHKNTSTVYVQVYIYVYTCIYACVLMNKWHLKGNFT